MQGICTQPFLFYDSNSIVPWPLTEPFFD
jgi:hypothetical protein